MKKIGILSDTHGRLREEVVEILRGCDVILHAGDINTPQALARLRELAPLYAVRGNADREWADALPQTLSEEICGLRIFMVHNKKEIPADVTGYDLVVYGPRRFSQPVTMAVAEVTAEMGDIRVIRKDIVQEGAGRKKEGQLSTESLHLILRDVDRGKSVSDIAVKYGLAKETAEQICRLYLTHPGIDAAGVKEKMAMPRDR